jgi:hypothetical protein
MAVISVPFVPQVTPLRPAQPSAGVKLEAQWHDVWDQTRGLLFYWNDPIASVNQIRPLTQLPRLASTVTNGTQFGLGLNCTANNRGARVASPAYLNGLLPVSLMAVWWQVAAPANSSEIFCVTYTNTDTTPFMQYKIGYTNTGVYDGGWNDGATLRHVTGSGAPANTRLHVGVFTIVNGAQFLYLDGVQAASDTRAASAAISVTPQIGIGCASSDITTRNPGCHVLEARIYNRALTAFEAREYSRRWAELANLPIPELSVALSIGSGGVTYPRLERRHGRGVLRGAA